MPKKSNNLFEIKSKNCFGLSIALIEYQAQKTSAEIMKRLQLCGHSGTNIDIVDITNYVAHEIGQPMHAFDFEKIAGQKISIENLEQEDEFIPLIGEKFKLNKGTLVIKDAEKIVSWPGVMGSENSKSELKTSKILVETGVFEIDSIQRRKHKIYTNASKRFEYGVDFNNLAIAINRFCCLLNITPSEFEIQECNLEKKIQFDLSYFKHILGKEYSVSQLKERLEPRGFIIDENLLITVPSYKYFDMHTPNCIVEEFVVGHLDKIESKNLPPKQVNRYQKSLELKIIETFIDNGFYETCNFSITSKESSEFDICEQSTNIRKIKNSSNLNYSILRATMIPQLLKIAQWHKANSFNYSSFFELDFVYGNFENSLHNTQQKIMSAICLDHEQLLKTLYTLFDKLNLQYLEKKHIQINWQDAGISFFFENTLIATIGKIKESICNEFDFSKFFALEIFVENLKNNIDNMPKKINKKPILQLPIYKDISFVLEPNIEIGMLTTFLKNQEYEFEIFDIYPSKLLTQKRNVGLKFIFNENFAQSSNEINAKIEKIKMIVKEKLNIHS